MAVDKGLVGGSTVLMLLSLLAEKDCYGYEIIKENRHDTRLHNEAGFDFRIAYMRGECAAAAIWNRRYAGNRQFLRFCIPCRGGDEQSAC